MKKVGSIIILLFFTFLQISAQEKTIPKKNTNGVCNGNAVYLPKPEFSEEAKKNVARNSIYVKILIDEQGNVKSAEAFSESPVLNFKAEEAALKAKFKVTTRSGIPVKVYCNIVYNFESKQNNNESAGFNPSIEVIKCYKCDDIAISLPNPQYPKYVGTGPHIYNGEVAVRIVIDKQGNIESAKGVSGHPYFRPILEREALKAKFKPRVISGKPVETSAVIVYKITSTKPIVISHFPPNTKPIFEPKLKYPKTARMANASGKVVVDVLVDEKGNVEKAKVVSGHPLLIAESLKAAKLSKFKPFSIGGIPVKARGILTYNFNP